MKIICPFFVAVISLHCNAQSRNVTECVGNLDIDFPGDVEIAVNSENMLLEEHKVGSNQPVFQFGDGEKASYSSIYYNGLLLISQFLNDKQKDAIFHLQEKNKSNAEKFSKNKVKNSDLSTFQEVNISPAPGVAFHIGKRFSTSIFINGHMLWSQASVDENKVSQYKKDIVEFSRNLSFRPIGSTPASSGLCFPYFFAKVNPDGDTNRRIISGTYRLKQHPDITIWIEDSNAVANQDQKSDSARDRINEFWSQYQSQPGVKKVESEWKFPSGKKVLIGKNDGLASLVRIIRDNGVIDYGYMATARSDGRQKKTGSNVDIYIIRQAENASSKGVAPTTSEEFIKISQGIISTIKMRWTE